MKKQSMYTVAVTIVVMILSISSAYADPGFGIRGGYYTDMEEAFLGGEFLTRIAPRLYFNPNMEYIFTDGSTFMTFNGDLHYDFAAGSRNYIWVGAGLGVTTINPDGPGDRQTDVGMNILFGAGFPTGKVVPYVQLKVMTGAVDDIVLGFGVRF